MADDSKMQMYEAQAMLIERERELQEARREIQQLRLDNVQQRIDQATAAIEKKFEDKLAELRINAEERTQLAEKNMRQQFEKTLGEENAALKVSIANIEDKINNKIDKKNYQENMTVMKQSTEENKIEVRRLLATTERNFQNQLERERENRVTAERNFQNQLAEIEQQMAREREDRVAAVRKIETQLAEKGETIRQHFEALQRRIDEQSGEIENLRAGQLEKAALVEKINEETKTMVGNISIHLENVSSELGFHSSALILGGWHGSMTDSICIFDSKENKWRTCKQKLPFKVANHGSAILNGKIYFMGGQNDLKEPLASCYKLEENGEWTKMADMNKKRNFISQSTIVFGSEIWVIGGCNESDPINTVEKYNPQTNIWTKMPDLNCKQIFPTASIIGGKIFVSGGLDSIKKLPSVEVYDPAKNKWEIFCDMPLELNWHCLIVEGSNLIIIGGGKSDGTPSDEVWKIDVSNPKKEWIKMPSLKQGRYSHGTVKLLNGIMVFGGSTDYKTQIDSVEIFDGISWKEGPKLPEKHGAFSFFPLSIKAEKQLLLQLC